MASFAGVILLLLEMNVTFVTRTSPPTSHFRHTDVTRTSRVPQLRQNSDLFTQKNLSPGIFEIPIFGIFEQLTKKRNFWRNAVVG